MKPPTYTNGKSECKMIKINDSRFVPTYANCIRDIGTLEWRIQFTRVIESDERALDWFTRNMDNTKSWHRK